MMNKNEISITRNIHYLQIIFKTAKMRHTFFKYVFQDRFLTVLRDAASKAKDVFQRAMDQVNIIKK